MKKLTLPCLAGILAACSAFPLADGHDYAQPGAYALLATPSLPILATTAGSTARAFPPANLADGNLATHWDSGGFRPVTAWAAVDLGQPAALASLVLKLPPMPAGTSFDVETSPDAQAWTSVLTGLTNATWSPFTTLLPPGTTGRWVRIVFHNDAKRSVPHFSLYELAVQGSFATPTPAPTPTPVPEPTPTPAPTVQGPFEIAATATAQFKRARLRVDLAGDTAGPDVRLEGYGAAFGDLLTPWHASCRCDLRLAGTDTSIRPAGPLELALPPAPGETGVLSGKSGGGDVAAVIWPSLNPAEVPGPPIMRIQLASWTPAALTGVQLDAEFRLTAADDFGNQIGWIGRAASVAVP